jgi:hypothetical protein
MNAMAFTLEMSVPHRQIGERIRQFLEGAQRLASREAWGALACGLAVIAGWAALTILVPYLAEAVIGLPTPGAPMECALHPLACVH